MTNDAEAATSQVPSGMIEGTVRYEGRIPHSDTPDNAGSVQPMLQVETSEGGLRYAVVYLVDILPEEASEAEAALVDVDQRDLEFHPRVSAVRAGQDVLFSNSDPENHNVRAHSSVARNAFNIVTSSGLEYEKAFEMEPDYAPILLACDIHAWMRAWVYVFDHPYFAVTDARGQFSIGPLPSGTYSIRVRQPDGRLRGDGEIRVESGGTERLNITFTPDDLGADNPLSIEETP